jgi:glutathione S-transferase
MIVLHQFEVSPFCDKIRRVLHVKGQPYEINEILASQSMWKVRRVSPMGKLPCLEHKGQRIADSTDIAAYLEEQFPEPPLIPPDPYERALCHLLEDWADESLYFYEMTLRFNLPHNARRFVPKLVEQDAAWFKPLAPWVVPLMMKQTTRAQGIGRKPAELLIRDLEHQVEALTGLLGDRQWLIGSSLTLADISVFAQLACIREADEGGSIIDRVASVAAWMERVDAATAKPR